MIRRDWPLGAPTAGTQTPSRWLLIPQPEHARLSWEFARSWGSETCEPIICPDGVGHPLASVREELLLAIKEHDAGWIGYIDHPEIDSKTGEPLNFTEMPPRLAQQLWDDSIDACRRIGSLAGWVVASHFASLQSKPDENQAEWKTWLDRINQSREEDLSVWLKSDTQNTLQLAKQSLKWLQAFDWISLWLCCYAPLHQDDPVCEPLEVRSPDTGEETIVFTPITNDRTPGASRIIVDPWPFRTGSLQLKVEAFQATQTDLGDFQGATLGWELLPKRHGKT